ncbi:MAG TPA: sugar ABC transporter permease, partial [Candidatus Binatia bacterium]|nr:sugar ABC transporter permease [Candidatus Binatia bacterium]
MITAGEKKALSGSQPGSRRFLRRWRQMGPLARKEALSGYLFILPWIVGFVVFLAGPMLASFALSFTRWNIVGDPRWVGLDNYQQIFTRDPDFLQSLKVTLRYAVIYLPLTTVIGIAMAVALNSRVRGIGLFRTLLYLPSVVPGVAATLVWVWVLNGRYGLLNTILGWFGIEGPNWFRDPQAALYGIVMISLWGVGGSAIIYLAGLQNIPEHLYEAARVDGASGWQQFRYVTLPMLSPVIFFQLVVGLIGVFQTFTSSFVATGGGPLKSTLFYMLYIYNKAWQSLRMGYASALAWILALIILIVTILVFRSSPYWVHYEAERE